MIKELIKILDKPLGISLVPYMPTGVHCQSSHATNLYQALRLRLARMLIVWGYHLLLKNGETWVNTGSSNEGGV